MGSKLKYFIIKKQIVRYFVDNLEKNVVDDIKKHINWITYEKILSFLKYISNYIKDNSLKLKIQKIKIFIIKKNDNTEIVHLFDDRLH